MNPTPELSEQIGALTMKRALLQGHLAAAESIDDYDALAGELYKLELEIGGLIRKRDEQRWDEPPADSGGPK